MRRIGLLIVCLAIGAGASSAFAVPLYGVSYEGDIYKINQSLSTYELFMADTGIAWEDATDGPTLDAFFGTAGDGLLYSVDVVSKTVVTIGSYGGPAIKALAYAESGAGVLYGSDLQNLYTINRNTGAATFVAPIYNGVDVFLNVNSMDYDPVADRLYIVNRVGAASDLYYVDQTTGFATKVAPLAGALPVTDIWYDSDTGKMYGVHKSTTQLYEINTVTGAVTAVGTTPFGSQACPNVVGMGSVNIPEPGMLMLLILGAAGLASPAYRRRR